MKNQNKYNIFEPMSKTFETDIIRNYFLDMVQEIPDYIFIMPSSTSGKYHNKTQCETYGQIYHVYMFSEILNYRLNLKGNKEKYNNPILRDCMRCIPAFHDAIKCGLKGSQYTVHEHPILAQDAPEECTFEHYSDVRENRKLGTNKYSKEHTALIGYCASYGGRYYEGGFGRDAKGDRSIYNERIKNLKKQAPNLKDIHFFLQRL